MYCIPEGQVTVVVGVVVVVDVDEGVDGAVVLVDVEGVEELDDGNSC